MQLPVTELDMEKRSMLLRDFQNGLTRFQANSNIIEKFGDCVGYGVRTCERWYTKFKRGDFDITKIPRDKCYKRDRSYSKRRRPAKTIKKVNEVTFKQQEVPPAAIIVTEKQANVENLLTKKHELTVSKVSAKNGAMVKKPPAQPNIVTKRLIKPSLPKLVPVANTTSKAPLEMPKLRPRRPRSQGIEIQLPVSAAKRMTPQTLSENHNIGVGNKGSNKPGTVKNTATKNIASREVTVQFQNITPEVAKNTVRKKTNFVNNRQSDILFKKSQNNITQKITQGFSNTDGMLKITNVAHIESMSPERSNKTNKPTTPEVSNKRPTPPLNSVSPLNNPKGIIYLNPQEIFRPSFGAFGNLPTRPNVYEKSVQQNYKNPKKLFHSQPPPPHPTKLTPPPAKPDPVVLSDSDDTGDDLLFPENVPLPAPKIKTDTFATYWDMESGKPIPLNNGDEPDLLKAAPIIEID